MTRTRTRIGYDVPDDYEIASAEVSNGWRTEDVLRNGQIVIDVDELLPYIQYDVVGENLVISLDVDVTLEAVAASVKLDAATLEDDTVTLSGNTAIDVETGTTVTLTPDDGYRITDVTSATGDINWRLNLDGTVTVTVQPSATDVYLHVETDTIDYTLTGITNEQGATIAGVEVNDIFTVEDETTVTITAANPSNDQLEVILSSGTWTVDTEKSIAGFAGIKSKVVVCNDENTWNMMLNMATHKGSALFDSATDEEAVEPAVWEEGTSVSVYYYEELPVTQVLVGTITGVTDDFTLTVE